MRGERGARPTRFLPAVAVAVLAVPAWGVYRQADAPNAADRAGRAEARKDARERHAPDDNKEGREGRRDRDRQPPSEAEWRDAAEVMRTLAPNALNRIESMPKDAPRRAAAMRRLVRRQQELARLRDRDGVRYEAEVNQLRLEDDILGILLKLRAAGGNVDVAMPLRQALREKVGELVDLRIRNREARIARLAKSLDEERSKLEADKRAKEQAVDRKMKALLDGPVGRHDVLAAPPNGSRKGGAGGGRRGGSGAPPDRRGTDDRAE